MCVSVLLILVHNQNSKLTRSLLIDEKMQHCKLTSTFSYTVCSTLERGPLQPYMYDIMCERRMWYRMTSLAMTEMGPHMVSCLNGSLPADR